MKVKLLFVFPALLAVSVLAYAQSPVGRWTGTRESGQGNFPTTLVIRADGTGTFASPNEIELEGIMIEGNTVSFGFTTPDGRSAFSITGEVDGENLDLTIMMGGQTALQD